ncbi:MAG: DNA polymerase I, partial [Clostridia bacterium]|nr:DNA polymerase I [Clostridia bacterium]
MQEICIVIDGNSLMHRAFHALPAMETTAGVPTNAVYGFASMLLRVLAEVKPAYCAVAFDMHGPTFRHADYPEYKAGRKPTDELLRPQFPLARRMLDAMSVRQLECPSYEADDILGALAAKGEADGVRMLLVTGDRDALQLVTPLTHVLYTKRGITDTTEFDPETVLEKYGVTPAQIPDLKGLMGDSSDNIPGVPGVGEKTAVKLLATYGSLEAALDRADAEQAGKLRERLLQHRELALLCKKIATIARDIPLAVDWEECRVGDLSGAAAFFQEIEAPSLVKRLPAPAAAVPPAVPASDFATVAPDAPSTVLASIAEIKVAVAGLPAGRVALHRTQELVTFASDAGGPSYAI